MPDKLLKDYFVILVLDDITSLKVRTLKLTDKDFKVPYRNFYPHINLGRFLQADKHTVVKAMKKVSKLINPFELNINNVEMLTEYLMVLTFAENDKLNYVHRKLHEFVPYKSDDWTDPKSGKYVPHISIYYNPGEDVREMHKHYLNIFQPFKGRVVAIELSEYDGQSFRVSHRYELKKRLF